MLKTSPNKNSLHTKSLLLLNFQPAGFYPNTMQYKGKVIPTQVQTQSSVVQLTNHKTSGEDFKEGIYLQQLVK